jgi:hypothetical protein
MNLIEYAKNELKISGYKPIKDLPKSDPNRWIQENILELPFKPKSFYVKVKKISNDVYEVIDKNQIKPMIEYYDTKITL